MDDKILLIFNKEIEERFVDKENTRNLYFRAWKIYNVFEPFNSNRYDRIY